MGKPSIISEIAEAAHEYVQQGLDKDTAIAYATDDKLIYDDDLKEVMFWYLDVSYVFQTMVDDFLACLEGDVEEELQEMLDEDEDDDE